MSAPRILASVVILGSQILGKAFIQAWRQAARNAKASAPAGLETNSGTRGGDVLSRTHRMTLDEASMILNIKKGAIVEESELQQMLKNFDHLFAANKPLTAEGKPHSSHYLQSKIVRAKERIEAEIMGSAAAETVEGAAAEAAGKVGKGGSAGQEGR